MLDVECGFSGFHEQSPLDTRNQSALRNPQSALRDMLAKPSPSGLRGRAQVFDELVACGAREKHESHVPHARAWLLV
jgi:hypothetical protein